MTSKFRRALVFVLENEGGDSDHPQDRGGRTRFGITAKTAKRHGFRISELTRDQAAWIYHKEYWEYEWISDAALATKVFDLAVNMGSSAANKLLQQAANDCGMCLAVDGLIGPKTRLAVNSLQPEPLIEKLVLRVKERYAEIIAANPSQKVFERGWMNRADRLPEITA
jgi:lysozyme family protein